jgi:hypothetical protein
LRLLLLLTTAFSIYLFCHIRRENLNDNAELLANVGGKIWKNQKNKFSAKTAVTPSTTADAPAPTAVKQQPAPAA